MSVQDFSRLGEIFYPQVGEQVKEVSLKGFLESAFNTYHKRYLSANRAEGLREVSYKGEHGSKISFHVSGERRVPDLSGLEIKGSTHDFDALFGLLRGNLNAEYSGLSLDEIVEPIREQILNSKNPEFVQVGHLGLYFSPDDDYNPLLKRLNLQKKKIKPFGFSYVPITLHESHLDDGSFNLIKAAEKISIHNLCYVEDDPKQDSVIETCDIIQSENENYLFTYGIKVVNHNSLPAKSFDTLSSIFELTIINFSQESFKTIKLSNPKESKLI